MLGQYLGMWGSRLDNPIMLASVGGSSGSSQVALRSLSGNSSRGMLFSAQPEASPIRSAKRLHCRTLYGEGEAAALRQTQSPSNTPKLIRFE